MKVWVYLGRGGQVDVYRSFSAARAQQDEDNGMTVDEIIAEVGDHGIDGSEESGHFSIDEGGSVTLCEIIED